MDAGVIASFKTAYRKKQLQWVYDKIKDGVEVDRKAYKVDQLQAMQWSKEIWQALHARFARYSDLET
ncbi:hypothetical protein PInf_009816 [Phytophthora infestans]|nr:hypothetical protein PInf_009816 [Phytophthora infestans]